MLLHDLGNGEDRPTVWSQGKADPGEPDRGQRGQQLD